MMASLMFAGYEVSTGESLGIVIFLLGSGVAASLLFPPSKQEEEEEEEKKRTELVDKLRVTIV